MGPGIGESLAEGHPEEQLQGPTAPTPWATAGSPPRTYIPMPSPWSISRPWLWMMGSTRLYMITMPSRLCTTWIMR